MSESLLSVGIDVGTTSTQLVFSRLQLQNRASAFAVPELVIGEREVLYKSPVHFTPLVGSSLVDGQKLRRLVEQEYANAGIRREEVDTGAVIVTGETSRRENAAEVSQALSGFAGDFVVATAGPDLESVLAARGAGAVEFSRQTGKTVLHVDIGGGTSNLCLIREGRVEKTGCLNVGGRLVKRDEAEHITYVSPVLGGLWEPSQGIGTLVKLLTRALEMAAGLRPADALLEKLTTKEAEHFFRLEEAAALSFSGGVAECIARDYPDNAFGDIGPALGRAIRESALCRGEYRLSQDSIRATVIGAGCYATQLSGSTVYAQNVRFPLKNLAVVEPGRETFAEGETILAMPGLPSPSYEQVAALASRLAERPGPLRICLESDMAKALGQALASRLPGDAEILCLDRVKAAPGSYMDVGAPVGAAFPVVVKTLVLGSQ